MKINLKLVSLILLLFFSTYSYGQHNDTVLMNSRIIKSFEIHNYLDNLELSKRFQQYYYVFGYSYGLYLKFDDRVYNVLDSVIAYMQYDKDFKVIVNISYQTKSSYAFCVNEQHIIGAISTYFDIYLDYQDIVNRILFNDLCNDFFLYKEGSNQMRDKNTSISILIYK